MKKQLLFGLLFVLGSTFQQAFGQTVIYSEDFTSGATWTLNTTTGPEGSNPNVWYISCQEDGLTPGSCGTACIANDNSLHIGADPLFGDNGALYIETGGFITDTDRRAESGNISTVGQTNLTLSFDLIGYGGNANDYCELFYSDDGGATWTSLDPSLTTLCCGSAVCNGALQGLWQNNTYALPVNCENIPNLRIGFVWKNLDDGIATDPSIAIDDVQITTPSTGGPTADFSASAVSLCEGDCIDFTDLSTVSTNPSWSWTFAGATTGTSSAQNPTGICYPTAGTYDVTLDVTDDNGTDQLVQVGYITVVAPPNAGSDGTGNVCNDNTLDLNTLLSGADPGGTWAETSGTPSGQFNTGTGVLDGTGLTVSNVYTFTYTVNATAPCTGTSVSTFTITVVDCSAGLTASFTPSAYDICVGDCITFTNNSIGAITTYEWMFQNGTPSTFGPSASFDPGSVCFNTAGTADIRLIVSDGTSSDDTTITITVNAPTVNAGSDLNICTGDPVTLTASGTAVSYSWDNGVTDGVSFTPSGTTVYTVTGTDAFGCTATDQVTVVVASCVPLVAGFEYIDNICVGDCITLTDTSQGVPITWAWDFGGGASPNTDTVQNPVVCFNAAGTYDIQLTVTDGGGSTSSTTNQITVFDSPTVTVTAVAGMIQPDTLIDLAGSAELIAVGSSPGSILWTPDDYVDCDTCSSTFASPVQDMYYTVTLTDVNGCTGQDSILVLVNFIEGIGVPQAFSPNGDGVNDILYVKGEGIVQMNFKVYNRYGQKVFESSEQGIGWDGKFHDRDENPGVFAWVLEYTFINGNGGILKGNTTLIR